MTQPHRIGGRYEVGELLGRGGMAEVRKGTDVRLGRTVAIKRLRTDLASDSTFQARFRREAQSAASLNDPSIVSVYDTGEEMATDGSNVAQPYIVMEYVAGRTLRDVVRDGRKILPERALEITSGVLRALDYSHRAGIIHRDIKPGNVMLTPAGNVKVMDFGIARAVSDASSTMTQTAAVVGTAQYLSPEQARGESVDSRSDVYSTGCLLYELLTGRPPFVGDSPVSVAYQHVREQAQPPSALDEDLTPEIDAIVMKSLAKDLDERYPSAAAMKDDIDRYLAGKPVEAPAVAAAATTYLPTAGPATRVTTQQQDDDEAPERKRRWPLVLGLLALLAAIVAGVLLLPRLADTGPEQVPVPSVTGMTRQQAERTITQAGLEVGEVTRSESEQVARGRVISQDPQASDQRDAGSAVDFQVSLGPPQITLPDVVGDDKNEAADALRAEGVRVVLSERGSDEPADRVVEMQPPAGTDVAEDSRVTLFWSDGPEQVPEVVGLAEAEARRRIEAAGFEVSVVNDSTTEAERGTVLQQAPPAGQDASAGSTVTIVVSTFQRPTPTPTPTPTPSETSTPTEEPSPTEDPVPTP
ncbi:Stk1 family PASTA domain-containing Ser/Thr kinase [Nocardioides aurantiacus]|uniref:non-specific serine/threonine protein kinase n=1 Tax=Nocardioides aurantiacus TaxID=86796 RepID=A0A3N2D0H4_9ACTN|nr:Stk1 family PASTA domain-containing Ser/Thr kinase [Nocardioides aurantiacus]ROR92954.1 serine/threonine-protein kinase [Nocardioides aurantiacus]